MAGPFVHKELYRQLYTLAAAILSLGLAAILDSK